MRKTIKEIYCLNQTTQETEQKYALDIWYNKLLCKIVDEIDIEDTYRMLSQNVFIELGIKRAMEILSDDPLAGQIYEGQLLELLYSINLNKFEDVSQLKILLEQINNRLPDLEWSDETGKKEYVELVINFMNKIKL